MNSVEFEQWKISSLEQFNELYNALQLDVKKNNRITQKSKLTSLLYLFEHCNFKAGEEILTRIHDDAASDNALATYLLAYISMYKYKGVNGGCRNIKEARELFQLANELNANLPIKLNP